MLADLSLNLRDLLIEHRDHFSDRNFHGRSFCRLLVD